MKLVPVINVSGVDRFIPLDDEALIDAPAGATVEVPEEIAHGRQATGTPGTAGFDPGTTGLLAQPDNWQPAKAGKTTTPVAGEEGDA